MGLFFMYELLQLASKMSRKEDLFPFFMPGINSADTDFGKHQAIRDIC